MSQGSSIIYTHESQVNSIIYDKTLDILATGDDKGCIYLSKLNELQNQVKIQLLNNIFCLDLHPEKKLLVSGHQNKTLKIINISTFLNNNYINHQSILQNIQEAHKNSIQTVKFSQNGDNIISGSSDKSIKIWNSDTGDLLTQVENSHKNWVSNIMFLSLKTCCENSELFLSGSYDSSLILWKFDTQTKEINKQQEIIEHSNSITSLCISENGEKVASGSSDNSIVLYEMKNQLEKTHKYRLHTDTIYKLEFCKQFLISTGRDQQIFIINSRNQAVQQISNKNIQGYHLKYFTITKDFNLILSHQSIQETKIEISIFEPLQACILEKKEDNEQQQEQQEQEEQEEEIISPTKVKQLDTNLIKVVPKKKKNNFCLQSSIRNSSRNSFNNKDLITFDSENDLQSQQALSDQQLFQDLLITQDKLKIKA